jgi:hypothetical protein
MLQLHHQALIIQQPHVCRCVIRLCYWILACSRGGVVVWSSLVVIVWSCVAAVHLLSLVNTVACSSNSLDSVIASTYSQHEQKCCSCLCTVASSPTTLCLRHLPLLARACLQQVCPGSSVDCAAITPVAGLPKLVIH